MCGVTGFLDRRAGVRTDTMADVIDRMTSTLSHRGPDDEGTWTDPSAGVALGRRRLAVIDLSRAGCQPMVSGGGRYVLTYNGEIYNQPISPRSWLAPDTASAGDPTPRSCSPPSSNGACGGRSTG